MILSKPHLRSPYDIVRVTKYVMHVLVFDDNCVPLFDHNIPVGTNCRDLDTLLLTLGRIYPGYNVTCEPLFL